MESSLPSDIVPPNPLSCHSPYFTRLRHYRRTFHSAPGASQTKAGKLPSLRIECSIHVDSEISGAEKMMSIDRF